MLALDWDVWFYERGTFYLWDHREIPADALQEAFRAVGTEY